MSTLLLAFALMLLIVAVMAVGVAMGRKPIAGSCGGLAQLGVDGECEICGGNPNACDSANDGGVATSQAAQQLSVNVGQVGRSKLPK